jgi:tetratricopeptide (TPR) repeat protein
LDKAIEIKRRAQRCIQNGDLDGALNEYEKLVGADDADPYNYVLLADLLYKKGDQGAASNRYLSAAGAYEKSGLYKNAIAVGKKMQRLGLAPVLVLERLGHLHALDGLATEASLYYLQHSEHMTRENKLVEAAHSLRKAFEHSPEQIKALEKLAEVLVLDGKNADAGKVLVEAAQHYDAAGLSADAQRCRKRAEHVQPGATAAHERAPSATADAHEPSTRAAAGAPSTRVVDEDAGHRGPPPLPRAIADDAAASVRGRLEGLESTGPPRLPGGPGSGADRAAREAEPAEAPSANGHPEEEETLPGGVGLRFQPAGAETDADAPAPEAPPAAAEPGGMQAVERLLAKAQEQFRAGQRELASATLVSAARAYDELGRHDSAATIYRSLAKSASGTTDVLGLWLANCERRGDRVEGAQVACELGDRALNDGEDDRAREWFQRAVALDAKSELAARRLQRMDEAAFPPLPEPEVPAPAPARPAPPAPASSEMEPGRVEVAVGRSEAVTFDLGALLSEFQRGVEAQLSGDAQSHYDLGMTYREMGLLEQAVESFQVAARDPAYVYRSAEMIGRCHLDQGRFEDAGESFAMALGSPDLSAEAVADLRFQLGLSHEAAGRTQEALGEFERVYSMQSSYPDVALKIRVLRKTLESV